MSDPSGILWPGDYGTRSEPASARRALALSVAVHLTVAALAVVWPLLWQGPRLDLSDAFVVNLVANAPRAGAPKAAAQAQTPAAEPEAKADAKAEAPEAKEAAPEKAVSLGQTPEAKGAGRESELARALEVIRSRVQREASVSAAIAQMRQRVATRGQAEEGVVASGQFTGGDVPLSFRLYYEEVWKCVRARWVLPSMRQQGLKAVVAVRIGRDGTIERADIESGSGDERFDRSALNAVRAASPLPPLPGDYLGRWHEIGIRFHQ